MTATTPPGVGAGLGDRTPPDPLDQLDPGTAQRAARENFPVALRLLPARRRSDLLAVYRYARAVDDVGDLALVPDRLAALGDVSADVARLGDGAARLPFVAPLAPLVARGLPIAPLLDLVEANRMDQAVASYAGWPDLLGYCRLSAEPVGRLVLALFNAATAERTVRSDAVCSALQVLEHLQDVGEDHARGRVYLPMADQHRHGLRAADLAADVAAGAASPALRALIADLAGRCRAMLAEAGPLVASLRWPARLAVAGFAAGGFAVLDSLHRAGYDTLSTTVLPARRDTAVHALALLVAPRATARRLAGRPDEPR